MSYKTLRLFPGRRSLILAFSALFSAILVLTLLSPTIEAKSTPSEGTLRQAVSGIQTLNAAVVDKDTSLSSIDGNDILFVDGNFYLQSNRATSKALQSEALEGVTIIFVGPGFKDFCASLNIGFGEPRTEDGVELPMAAYGLKIMPQRSSNGAPITNKLLVNGNSNDLTSSTIPTVLDWYAGIDSSQSISINDSSTGSMIMSSGAQWEQIDTVTSYYWEFRKADGTLFGRMDISEIIAKLMNDNEIDADYYFMHTNVSVHGGDSDWRNKKLWEDIDINSDWLVPHQDIIEFGPFSTPSWSTAQVGVSLGFPSGISISAEWTYPLYDVSVDQTGMPSTGLLWQHNINPNSSNGTGTFTAQPGFGWRTEENAWIVEACPYFQGRWKNSATLEEVNSVRFGVPWILFNW